MTSQRTEYRAKVTVDTGMARGRVPTPLLKQIGARPGDYLTFRLVSTGEVVMRLLRGAGKQGKGKRRS
jgi:hypothetical protein